jgi:hypothetical protein
VKRRILVALALIGLLSVVLISRAGAATQSVRHVTRMGNREAVVGSSTLTRTNSGISFSLQTTELQAGHAVTIWWMVVNPNAEAPSVLYAAGHVIDESGTAEFGGYLQVGDTDGILALEGLSLEGLQDAAGADVALVVRDHGPAKPGIVDQQIHTFGVCNPTCTDLQVSEHPAS